MVIHQYHSILSTIDQILRSLKVESLTRIKPCIYLTEILDGLKLVRAIERIDDHRHSWVFLADWLTRTIDLPSGHG
jgi:hypothetical protein